MTGRVQVFACLIVIKHEHLTFFDCAFGVQKYCGLTCDLASHRPYILLSPFRVLFSIVNSIEKPGRVCVIIGHDDKCFLGLRSVAEELHDTVIRVESSLSVCAHLAKVLGEKSEFRQVLGCLNVEALQRVVPEEEGRQNRLGLTLTELVKNGL